MRNTYWPIAERTPISATRSARRPNSSSSRGGSPNSLTSVAPGAEKRSVICVVIAALWPAASRSRWASREPIRRAGITKIGSSTSVSRVIDHDRRSITASVRTRAMTLLTTPDSVHVNARWAPITSLLRRLTSAPVRVRMKNATGIRCTWANTARRRSRITPSPIFADCHRSASPKPASATATTAISDGQGDDRAGPTRRRDLVDDAAGEHRRGDGEQRPDDAEHDEPDQRPAVRPGEGEDPPQRRLADGPPLALAVDRALHRHPVAEVHLHQLQDASSSRLEVNELTVSLGTLPG